MINVHEATCQEIFDYVVEFLLRQNEKSVGEIGSFDGCMYRTISSGNSGNKVLCCAVGCLLPEDQYHPKYEGENFSTAIPYFIPLNHTPKEDLLLDLQCIHDERSPFEWKTVFRNYALSKFRDEDDYKFGDDLEWDSSKFDNL